jgi:predicted ArsR family transcriptional regulator
MRRAIKAVAALDDELRHGMFSFIRRMRRPVSRDEAAASVGISRKLAAFHLDKLVEAGVLQARFESVDGVRKVGRRPKVYEPVADDLQVTIPQRQHDVLASILVDAVLTERAGETAQDAAVRVARAHGTELGVVARAELRPGRLGAERALSAATTVAERHGFEPDRKSPTCVRLRNCPFHPLAAAAPELVCGINHGFFAGLLAGLDASTVDAVLDPSAGECCVELRAAR